jgi:hypothetical protein
VLSLSSLFVLLLFSSLHFHFSFSVGVGSGPNAFIYVFGGLPFGSTYSRTIFRVTATPNQSGRYQVDQFVNNLGSFQLVVAVCVSFLRRRCCCVSPLVLVAFRSLVLFVYVSLLLAFPSLPPPSVCLSPPSSQLVVVLTSLPISFLVLIISTVLPLS